MLSRGSAGVLTIRQRVVPQVIAGRVDIIEGQRSMPSRWVGRVVVFCLAQEVKADCHSNEAKGHRRGRGNKGDASAVARNNQGKHGGVKQVPARVSHIKTRLSVTVRKAYHSEYDVLVVAE